MKKLSTLALSLALTASLAAPAFAANEGIMLISAPVTYGYEITVNGTALDTAALPMADEGYVPMRLLAESDHGSASWYAEENSSWFYFDGFNYTVNFADNTVTKGEDKLDVTVVVKNGVTFLPVSVFDGIEGYTVTVADSKIDIVTPNGAPLVQLGYSIIDASDASCRMKSDAEGFLTNFKLDYSKNFEVSIIFNGMNISADTLFIGQMKKGADVAAVKAALEEFRAAQARTFEHYMPQNLPKVEAAKVTISGDYVLFLIAENSDKGVELFNEFVKTQK